MPQQRAASAAALLKSQQAGKQEIGPLQHRLTQPASKLHCTSMKRHTFSPSLEAAAGEARTRAAAPSVMGDELPAVTVAEPAFEKTGRRLDSRSGLALVSGSSVVTACAGMLPLPGTSTPITSCMDSAAACRSIKWLITHHAWIETRFCSSNLIANLSDDWCCCLACAHHWHAILCATASNNAAIRDCRLILQLQGMIDTDNTALLALQAVHEWYEPTSEVAPEDDAALARCTLARAWASCC